MFTYRYVTHLLQVPVTSWFDDMNDTELLKMIPFLKQLSTDKDVYGMLAQQYGGQT